MEDLIGCSAGDVRGEKISLAVDSAWGMLEYGCDGVIAGEINGVKNTYRARPEEVKTGQLGKGLGLIAVLSTSKN